MEKTATYISFILIILGASYIGNIIAPAIDVFDGSSNHFEILYLDLTSFLVQGGLVGFFLMAVNILPKVSKFSLCNLLFVFALVWLSLESIRVGFFDMGLMVFKIVPFILGATASMFFFEYAGYLIRLCRRRVRRDTWQQR